MSAHNQHRLVILAVVTALACILLLVRLGYLQIARCRVSPSQCCAAVGTVDRSDRGLIDDRLGRPLTNPGGHGCRSVSNQVKDLRALLTPANV